MAKKKQKSLPKLKKELWTWFALYIKHKYSLDGENCRCFTCGKHLKIGHQGCHAGHYLPKGGYSGLYFDEMNVRPQCYFCNRTLQGDQLKFREHLVRECGADAIHELEARRREPSTMKRADYMDKIEYYKDKVKKMSGG